MQLLDRTVKNGDYYFVCPCCGAYTIPQEDENGFVIDLFEEKQNRRKEAEERKRLERKEAEERRRLEREANEIDNNFKIYSFIILEIIITLLVVWGIVNVYQAF
jgi:uncharacterized membrane protein